jgi:putative glutathione S-transferase
MGMLVNGKWEQGTRKPDAGGRFVRNSTTFRHWIRADGSTDYAPEAGRYHLYVSLACPWAHRTLIARKLKGLEQAISLSVVDPFMGELGWAFSEGPGCIPDTVNGKRYLHEVYAQAVPDYTGRASVPVLWDLRTGRIVNNESREILRMLDHEFGAVSALGPAAPDFCPAPLRAEVEAAIDAIYEPINNGVYKCGFATTQAAYDEAVRELFAALARWEGVLARQRYLCGDVLTEADWCLFTTLVRFDPVYHFHFKCNLARLQDLPNLWNYLKELYQLPGVAETCDFDHIKQHYYRSHPSVNPTRIVPAGPAIDLKGPHDRNRTYAPTENRVEPTAAPRTRVARG